MSLITLFKAAVTGQRFRPADFNKNMTDIETAVNGLDASRVKNTTNETIAGIKTFSSSPVVPAPVGGNDAANKTYVDGLDAANVHKTGNETVAGVKTFSSSPVVPTPSGVTDAANKGYVDGYAAPVGHVGSGGSAHADAIAGGADGFMTGADKAKLDGIATGAQVNNISDANATDLTDGGDTALHTHDSRYYTEIEADNLLASKAPATHLADLVHHASYAAATGTNDYSVTLNPAPSSYTPGMLVNFKASATNTDVSTLNCNGLGAVSIRKDVTGALAAGDIALNQIVTVIYDGTYFQVVSGSGGAGGSAPVELVSLSGRTTLSVDSGTAGISIVGFDSSKDTLLAYQNGVFILGDGNDYSVVGTDIVKTSGTWAGGTSFDFVVYKTVLSTSGFDFTAPTNGQVAMYNSTTGTWQNQSLPAQTAANTTIADAGSYFASSEVEGALQEIGAAKAPLASPTFTGTVTLPSSTSIGSVSATEIGYVDGVTSAIQTQLNAKAPLASPALTGTPTAPTAVVGTDTTQIATTAFVNAELANDAPRKSASAGTVVNFIWSGTQAQYDAIGTKDANTLYFIV